MLENDYSLTIAKDQIATMPIAAYRGSIFVADTPQKAQAALKELLECKLIGFDTETKPSFRKGTAPNKMALMQLCSEKCCYLLRVNKVGFPKDLARLLEDPGITKIGLSVHDDFHVLDRSCKICPRGFVELQEMVRKFKISDSSLQKIYAIIFGNKISKSQRLTNWEADELTASQQVYAATDAWACLKIYNTLVSGDFVPDNSPYKVSNDAEKENA